MMLTSFFTDKKTFTVTTSKNPQNDRLYHIHQPRRKTPAKTKCLRTQY